jgi:uncharacterized membrane protein YidH (DUF202 family)
MLIAIIICTILTLMVSALPLPQHTHWVIRGMDFARLQIMTFSSVLLIASALFLDLSMSITWVLISVTGICFI